MSYQKRVSTGFSLAVFLIFSVSLAVYFNFFEMKKQREQVVHTYEVILTLDNILSDLKDIQSSVRGYAITGTQNYLTPYFLSVPKVEDDVKKLALLISDNPNQTERLVKLNSLVSERLEIASDVIEAYKVGGQESSFDLIKKGTGKSTMDEIRAVVGEMTTEEKHLLDVRQMALVSSSKLTITAGVIGLISCLSVMFVMFIFIRRETLRREKTENELNTALGKMEKITNETRLIGRLGDYLRGCRTEDEAYEIIRKNIEFLFPNTYGTISIFNNSRNFLQRVLEWGAVPALPTEFEPDSCWALRQGRIHQSVNDGVVPLCDHLQEIKGRALSVCIPMQAQGETLGQIYMGSDAAVEMDEYQVSVIRNVSEQVSLALANLRLQRTLKEQSIKDPLTRLFNRRYLEETLMRETARAQRSGYGICALMMDIDHFKKVNDTYGHDGGDAVLVEFAKILATMARKDDIACRLGGEEFVLVLPASDIELAKKRAEEICEAVRKSSVKFQDKIIKISVSIGISSYPSDAETPDMLLQKADIALYEAKKGGRDRAVVYAASA